MTSPLDFAFLASAAVKAISPFLPSLLHGGGRLIEKVAGKALEKVGEHVGDDGWNKAEAIWRKLEGPIENNPSASAAIADLATNPSDDVLRQISVLQIQRVLAADQNLAGTVATLLGHASNKADHGSFINPGTVSNSTIIVASSGAKVNKD